jgi:hypothetical protein
MKKYGLIGAALRRRRAQPARTVSSTSLGHQNPSHPHTTCVYDCRILSLDGHDQEQQEEGREGKSSGGKEDEIGLRRGPAQKIRLDQFQKIFHQFTKCTSSTSCPFDGDRPSCSQPALELRFLLIALCDIHFCNIDRVHQLDTKPAWPIPSAYARSTEVLA